MHPDAPRNASLYGALNRTVTPMGARRLRDWLSQPLAAVAPIERRQEAVQALLDHPAGLEGLRAQLEQVRDLERTLGRLSAGAGNARDLLALRLALAQFPGLKATLQDLVAASARRPAGGEADASLLRAEAEGGGRWLGAPAAPAGSAALGASRPAPAAEPSLPPLLDQLAGQVTALPDLEELIARAVVDEPPLALKEGGLIRDGFDAGLDELRAAMRGGKDWIAKLQQDEITRTGIQSLKVRFNSVFGYYIEVTKANLGKVPPHYLRKQTIANGERFITPALKEMEGKILGAEERSVKLEYELFQQVREAVLGRLAELLRAAAALAQLDVLGAFAQTARLFNYCRPQLDSAGGLVIRDGRHPVLEQTLREERFVPNDTRLEGATQIALITGPNMAGKSTYIRQVALLTLLAHTGAFIPAAEARIGLVDRIFTRIGASDDLARGQSTFMVEMCETAYILHHATPRSLIILDELGRGTSTFDGLSLAWSILEHLHNQVGAKTLFATHYHELTELAARLPRLKNYNVAVREWHDQIVFLRKIVEGGTDKSYGLQVARMAGVPSAVLQRAKEILRNLEESELTPEGNVRQATRRQRDRQKLQQLAPPPQLDLFG
jgi:DNA mismatch repair protein MutS